jgi:hypothetical protein
MPAYSYSRVKPCLYKVRNVLDRCTYLYTMSPYWCHIAHSQLKSFLSLHACTPLPLPNCLRFILIFHFNYPSAAATLSASSTSLLLIAKKLRTVEEFTTAIPLVYCKEINCNQSILSIVEVFAIALPILDHLVNLIYNQFQNQP